MAMTRVWNITDDVNPDVKPQNLRVLGKLVVPGRFVEVEEASLKRAHKVNQDVGRGLLFIGKNPPSSYARGRKPARAKLAADVGRVALSANRPEKKVLELEDTVKVEDAVAVETAPAPEAEAAPAEAEAPVEETEDEAKGKGKKKKGK